MTLLERGRARWSSLPGFRPTLPPSPDGEGDGAPAHPPGRARVPTVLQMEALECGAACLAMVLGHYRRHVPLEELRAACGVSRDGSKASNVLRAARAYGLEARGFRKEPEQLRALRGPMIVHWNFNHFVVLEGFRRGKAYLNDPGRGPSVISMAEFDQSFTGVVLTFEKTPEFRTGGERRGLLGSLLPRVRGSESGLLFVVLAGLALVIPSVVVATFHRVFVDDVLVKGLQPWLRPLLILMGVTGLVQFALTWLQQHYLLRLESRLALGTSARFFWHVLRLPVSFFNQRYAGEIGNRVAINDKVARLLSGELATTVLNLVVIVFYAALMLQYDVLLTVVSVTVVSINLAVLRWTERRRTELNQRMLQDRGKMMGAAMGGLQTIETLKASGSESDFFSRWSGHQAKVVNAGQQLALTTQRMAVLPPMLSSVNSALILGMGGFAVMQGRLSMGMLMAFQALVMAFINPVNRMVALGATLSEVKGSMNRLDDVLRAPPDPRADAELHADTPTPDETKLAGHVEIRGLSFGYGALDPPLITDFSMTLRPGSRVALVGGSGSGKSTISRLVAGLYEPWTGEILFDGRRREEVPRAVMNNSLAIVDQDVFLFEDTIRENVTLWEATIPEQDVVQAARDAAIHDDVAGRFGGYASEVEEGGRNFSGGQRQRLEIARALALNPTVLVLDEATSALDPTTEKIIDDNLRRRGCTCLIVAHRLSTIRDCDEIIVMERGRIVQRGTHDQMAGVDGPYRSLISAE